MDKRITVCVSEDGSACIYGFGRHVDDCDLDERDGSAALRGCLIKWRNARSAERRRNVD